MVGLLLFSVPAYSQEESAYIPPVAPEQQDRGVATVAESSIVMGILLLIWAWEKGRSTGLTKNIPPLSLIKKRYSKVTGKTVCDRLFKNMRATRSKELTLVPETTHQTVCKWIGNTVAVSNEHYLSSGDSHVIGVGDN